MHCTACGRELTQYANYCSFCGAHVNLAGPHRRLTRSITEKRIAGVCGGIAEYLNVDPIVVRLAWVVFSFVPGGIVGGLFAYLAAWLIVPKARPYAGATVAAPAPPASAAQ